MKKPVRAIIGFLVGATVAFVLIGLLFTGIESASGRHAYPRGGGWLFFIVGAGIACSRLFVALEAKHIQAIPLKVRVMVIGPLTWLALVLSFVWVFEPFGSYVSDDKKWLATKIVIFPIAVGFIGYFGYRFLFKRDERSRALDTNLKSNASEADQPSP